MPIPFLGEIKIVSFNFPPKSWALCNGQLLPINQNQALFSILGTTYGGNGQTTFALPNLQGRVPIHPGNGHVLGEAAGEQSHTLSLAEMPTHAHTARGSTTTGLQATPANNVWAPASVNPYSSNPSNAAMSPAAITNTGGSQPHENMSPYLVLSFIIALQGIFPSQN